jgi:hypothetical protein
VTPGATGDLSILILVLDWLEARGLRYQVGGSLASSVHGVPRQTRDMDIVVDLSPEAALDFARAFSDSFYVDSEQAVRAARDRRGFNLVHLESGLKIDVFAAGESAFDESEMQRSVSLALDEGSGRRFPVKSAEDTVLRKLLWFEQGDRASSQQWYDVLGVLKVQQDALDRAYLERWASSLGLTELLTRAMREAWD